MQIHLTIDGVETGPLAVADVEDKIQKKLIDPTTTLAWSEGMDGWVPLSTLLQLKSDNTPEPDPDNVRSTLELDSGCLPLGIAVTTGTVFEHDILLMFDAVIQQSSLVRILEEEVKKNGNKWPTSLNGHSLARFMRLVYLPYWYCGGSATCKWDAQVGTDREVPSKCSSCDGKGHDHSKDLCSRCGGNGQGFKLQTFFTSHNGSCVAEGRATLQNWSDEMMKIEVSVEPGSGSRKTVDRKIANSLTVVQPLKTSRKASLLKGADVLKNTLESNALDQARSLGDRVQGMNLTNVELREIEADPVLYPIWIGRYPYEEKTYDFQINAVSGQLWFDLPPYFAFKRALPTVITTGVIFSGIAFAVYYFFFR